MLRIGILLKNKVLLSLGANGIAAAAALFTFGLLSRQLSPSAFGTWMLFLVITSIMDMLRSGLLQMSLVRWKALTEVSSGKRLIGSAWLLAILATLSIIILWLILGLLLPLKFSSEMPFFQTYVALYMICSLPHNFALWLYQAEGKFGRIMWLRTLLSLPFLVFVLISARADLLMPEQLLPAWLLFALLASVICLLFGKTRLPAIRYASKSEFRNLFAFGKYSIGTLVGAHLLRSSDSLLIGALLSPGAVAAYAVPFKFIELIEMPLRSIISVFMPGFAAAAAAGETDRAKQYYFRYTTTLTLIFIPVAFSIFLFAEPLVVLVAGPAYGSSAHLLRILILYTIFLPLDRFSGVALDLLNRPGLNLLKVIIMLALNITGDLIAILIFNSLEMVAFVSIMTFFTGLWLGNYFLQKNMDFKARDLVLQGLMLIRGKTVTR